MSVLCHGCRRRRRSSAVLQEGLYWYCKECRVDLFRIIDGPKIVKPLCAWEGDVVRVIWYCKDETIHNEEYTCPPKETRKVRDAKRNTEREK